MDEIERFLIDLEKQWRQEEKFGTGNSWIRPRINTYNKNAAKLPNYKSGGFSNSKSANRLKAGRNITKLYASQQSPPRREQALSTSQSQNRSKYDDIKSRVYDHLSPSTSKTKPKYQPKMPTFTPCILAKSK